jgi:ABC-type transport system substrate-binding protein
LNSERAPLNNSMVRKAIVEAVNVSQMQQTAFGGYAIPFVGPMPSGFPLYNSSIRSPTYNLTDAKKLLVAAGFPNGQGLPTLKFLYVTSPYTTLVEQLLVQDLGQIGITVSGQGVTINTYQSIAFSLHFNQSSAPDIIENPWAWWPDFSGYGFLVDDQLGFFFYFHNQTINNYVAQANSEIDPGKRAFDISQVASLTQQTNAFIWLAQYTDTYNPGTFTGTFVWNKCDVSGLWYSPSWLGVPYNSVSSTC